MRRFSPILPAAALYVLLATILTWPLVLHLGDRVANDLGDPLLNTWILAWNARAVPLTEQWWNAPQFYPIPGTTAFSEHLLGLWPLTTPVIKATGNALLAYNLAFLLSFVCCGLAGHALGWSVTRRHDAALIAGLAFGFAPYRAAQLSHLQVLAAYWMPLALVGLHEFLRDRRVRWLMLFGGAWLMQALTCGYYFFYLSILIGFWLIWFAIGRERWSDLARVVGAWMAAVALMAPVLYGYWKYHRTYGFRRWPDEITGFSADVASVLKAPDNLRFWGWLDVINRPESEIFPGLTIVVLIATGLAVAWRQTRTERLRRVRAARLFMALGALFVCVALTPLMFGSWKFAIGGLQILSVGTPHKPLSIAFLFLAIAGTLHPSIRGAWLRRSALAFYGLAAALMWILCLGPSPTLMWEPIIYKAPYTWLMALPGVDGVRVPARFWMLAVACLSAAAALAHARLVTRWPRLRTIITVAACAGIVIDGWHTRLKLPEPPERRPSRTHAVARLELPLWPGGDLGALYRSISHERPLINGYSGFFAPHYWVLQYLLEQHDSEVLMRMAEVGDLEIVIDHIHDEDKGWRSYVAAQPRAEIAFVDEHSTTYRLRQSPVTGSRGPIEGPSLPIQAMTASVAPQHLGRVTDGDLVSRWEAGRGQEPGDSITVDLGQVRDVRGIELYLGGYVADFPRRLHIGTSLDGATWTEVWSGPTGAVTLTGALSHPRSVPMAFEIGPRPARHIRLTQLGSDPIYYWSIAELRVIGE